MLHQRPLLLPSLLSMPEGGSECCSLLLKLFTKAISLSQSLTEVRAIFQPCGDNL